MLVHYTLGLLAVALFQFPGGFGSVPDEEYVEPREFVSPVSGERFTAYVLKENLPASSYDYDQCPHTPINVLAYTLVIDPVTGYVDYPRTFAHTHWTAKRLAEVLGEPQFNRQAPASLPWAEAYPWEKLENAAKMAADDGVASMGVANWWMMAAWAVRLDVISGNNEFDDEVASIFASLPKRPLVFTDLTALYELQLASYLHELRGQGMLAMVDDETYALAQAWLYRSRGELTPAAEWLERARLASNQVESHTVLRDYLESSIALERRFLENARAWMIKAWNSGELSRLEEGPIAYLVAEMYRRLGETKSCIYWYDLALEKNYGGMSDRLIEQQRTAVIEGPGY